MLDKNKTKILAFVLGVVVVIFVSLIYKNMTASPSLVNDEEQEVAEEKNSAVVYFEPPVLDISGVSGSTAVDIMVDSIKPGISGIEIELQFDPAAISGVSLLPSLGEDRFFGNNATVLFNEVDEVTGTVNYAIAISPGGESTNTFGKIATLDFVKNLNTTEEITTISYTKILMTTSDGVKTELAASPILIQF